MNTATRRFNDILTLARVRGFVFASSDIYGGLQGAYDYGPLGTAMKRNLAELWWRHFVHRPESKGVVHGLDSSVILAPKVWEVSGHVGGFQDPLSECSRCKKRSRTDHLVEEATNTKVTTTDVEELAKIAEPLNLACPHCNGRGTLSPPRQFNLLMSTRLGPAVDSSSVAYLRPETAQGAFINAGNIANSMRATVLPFGIAQIGKAFRNEVTPGNFIFRTREFDQMEMQWLYDPAAPFSLVSKKNASTTSPATTTMKEEIQRVAGRTGGGSVLTTNNNEEEEKEEEDMGGATIDERHHRYWLEECLSFCIRTCGLRPENLRVRWHAKEELAHYSTMTADIEYHYPFGWGELWGIANRGNYDIKRHFEASGKFAKLWSRGSAVAVVEPSLGLNRLLLACLCDSFVTEHLATGAEPRNVLRLPPRVAPFKAAVLPLTNANKSFPATSLDLHAALVQSWHDPRVTLDNSSASLGTRYRRQDEAGTKWCVVVDNETLATRTVAVRERDSRNQRRVPLATLVRDERCLEELDFAESSSSSSSSSTPTTRESV